MSKSSKAGLAAAFLAAAVSCCWSQTAAPSVVGSSGAAGSQTVVAGSPVAPADNPSDTRSEKQKALSKEADRLFEMAIELKAQVDKTNKNILSMTVVRKAEEIQALAKGMKEQAKR